MHVYVVALEKGGVGKTALAVNLAVAFQQVGLNTLLIDLDAQASATHWLGIDPTSVPVERTALSVFSEASMRREWQPAY